MEVKTFMMNVIENVVDVTKKGAAESSEASGTQTSSELTILSMMQIALAADFAKFQNQNKAKTLIEALRAKVDLQTRALTRSASLPPRKNSKLSAPQNSKKSTQKSQPSKVVDPPRQSDPKVTLPKPSLVPGTSRSIKTTCSEATPKSVCCKGKKKIHKNYEARKENPKRMWQPSLIATAQIPRMRFGEKERRRIRRLLLQREVVSWTHHQEQRREGRELRHQH